MVGILFAAARRGQSAPVPPALAVEFFRPFFFSLYLNSFFPSFFLFLFPTKTANSNHRCCSFFYSSGDSDVCVEII